MTFWNRGDREKALQKMAELFKGLADSGKEKMPIKRVEFFLLMVRYALVMDQACQENVVEHLKTIEDNCETSVNEYKMFELPFYYFLALVKSGNGENIDRAQRLSAKWQEILPFLDDELHNILLFESGKNAIL